MVGTVNKESQTLIWTSSPRVSPARVVLERLSLFFLDIMNMDLMLDFYGSAFPSCSTRWDTIVESAQD